jgi:hypothetical protein
VREIVRALVNLIANICPFDKTLSLSFTREAGPCLPISNVSNYRPFALLSADAVIIGQTS